MLSRGESLKVTKAAAQVLDDFAVREAVLGGGFTRIDPIALAERAGVHVMCRPLNQLLGAFIREEQPGILLNTQRSAGMIHMTCAHELGHFFLDHATTADERLDYGKGAGKHELEADQFAYTLVAPAWLLAHVVRERDWASHLADPRIVYQLSLRLGLSYEATVWTLARQRRIGASAAERLAGQKPIAIKRSMLPVGQTVMSGQEVWVLNTADRNSVLQPRAGDRFIMTLPDHGSAGLLWQARDAEQAGYTLRPLPIEPVAGPEVPVGAVQQVLFEVEIEGLPERVEVDVQERRPWLPSTNAADEVRLTAQFESIGKGLTGATKRRLIEGFRG
jgi:Zn-dependent peptidase ImmA (M78 family)